MDHPNTMASREDNGLIAADEARKHAGEIIGNLTYQKSSR
jgi:hypothetical protein